tara:strand:+ start:24237 stop:24356 length:120 start_codon:yes stop_codon:yes gene_type:complete
MDEMNPGTEGQTPEATPESAPAEAAPAEGGASTDAPATE